MTTAISLELVTALDAMLGNYSSSLRYRAEDERENYATRGQPNVGHRFGELWGDYDYAWRVLLNPAFQAEVVREVSAVSENPASAEQLSTIPGILAALSEMRSVDSIMQFDLEENEFIVNLADELLGYFRTGSVPEYCNY